MNTARRTLLYVSLLCSAFLYAAQSGNDLFQKGLAKERTEADFRGAIKLYERVVKENSKDRKLAALALFRIGECQQALRSPEASKTFERIVKEYGEQADVVAQAQARLAGASPNSRGKALRQIASGPDATLGWLGGSISSDGRYLAFYLNREIVVRDLIAKTSRVVARRPATEDARDGTVVWSPDGKRLAFCTHNPELGSRQLGVVNADGSGSRILVGATREGGHYLEAWSPDSRRILAVHYLKKPVDRFSYVWINASDATTDSISVSVVPRQRTTRVSPDGAYIAVGTNNGRIRLIASDGKRETNIGSDEDTPVGWSHDGKYVLVVRNASFSPNGPGPSLWAIPLTAGNAQGEPVLVHRKFESDKWENNPGPNAARVHFLGTTTFGALYYSVLFTTDMPEIWALENFLPTSK